MRRSLLLVLLLTMVFSVYSFAQIRLQKDPELKIQPRMQIGPVLALLARPDLVPTISGPERAEPGQEISLKITGHNKGKAHVKGTAAGPDVPSYVV